MYTAANEDAAVVKTMDLIRRLIPNTSFTEFEIADYIRQARRSPGVTFSTGGLSFVHYAGSNEPDDWSETRVYLNIAEFLKYSSGVEQQFVHQRGEDEFDESVPEDWK